MELTQTQQVENTHRNILKLALPISISILIPQVSIMANTLFLGNYKPTNQLLSTQDMLAASGIAGIFYLTLVMIGYGVASGLLMLMSRKAGQNDALGLGKLFSNGVILCLILSFLLVGISYIVAPLIFNYSIHDAHIRHGALEFVQLRTLGLPFIMICQLSNSLFLATSTSNKIIIGSLVQTIFNIILDYLLIFGYSFFPEWGLNGSAIACVLSEIIYFLTVLYIIRKSKTLEIYKINYFVKPDWELMRQTFIKSSPLIMQYFLSIGAWELFFIYIEHLGKTESAVSQILRSVFGFVGIITWALASTCNSMVSNLIGQNLLDEVIPLIKKTVTLSFLISFFLGIFIFLFPADFMSIFTEDAEMIAMGIPSLRIVAVASWMMSVSTIFFNGVLGTGNTRINMIFEFVSIILYISYSTIVIENLRLSLPIAWTSEFVYWISLFGLSSYFLFSGRWKKLIVLENEMK